MLRAVAVGVLAAGTIALSAEQRRPADRARVTPAEAQRLEEAMTAYAGGDDRAAERWIASARGLANLAQLDLVVRRASTTWQRSTPAFVLEVAAVIQDARTFRVPDLLKLGQSLIVGRPAAWGADAAEDRFELLWHQAALGVAQGIEQYWLQQDLLDVVRLRFTGAGQDALLRTTRVPLARAVAAAGLCCWERGPGEIVQMIPPSGRRPVTADQALALFEAAAAAIPALRVEALIRGAVLLSKLGRSAEALAWFDRVPAHDDRVPGYVQQLTLARLLDAADRAGDASAAYRRALDAEPRSQLAAIGLAASLLRSGRAADAADTAARARTMGPEPTQHDQAFRRGDLRFVPEWLVEIRRLRR
jgi:tetratricopeptide (TPR) repeat protein